MSGENLTKVAPAWDQVHGLRGSEFKELAENLRENLRTIKALTEDADTQKAELARLLAQCGQDAVLVGDVRVGLVKGRQGAAKLDSDKLLKLGVPASTIQAAMVVPPLGKPYVRLFTREESE